jgi:hypothetical protein
VHDGRAATLKVVALDHARSQGVVSNLTAAEIDDLVRYLLGSRVTRFAG